MSDIVVYLSLEAVVRNSEMILQNECQIICENLEIGTNIFET